MLMDVVRVSDCMGIAATGLISGCIPITPGDLKTGMARLVLTVLLTPYAFKLAQLYNRDIRLRPRDLLTAALALACVIGVAAVLPTAAQLPNYTRLPHLLRWLLYSLVAVTIIRVILAWRIQVWNRNGRLTRNVIVVGTSKLAARTCRHLQHQTSTSVCIVRRFFVPLTRPSELASTAFEKELFDTIRDGSVDQVVLAFPWDSSSLLSAWFRYLRNLPVETLICPPLPTKTDDSEWLSGLEELPVVRITRRPLAGWSWLIKALEDRLLAAALLLALAPIMAAIALLIRLDSPGPILFRQKRHGFSGKVFDVLKFRTMYANVAEAGIAPITQAIRGDPRVTNIGRWLRRTSLDELPQLINVLTGQMSIVGPRPHAVSHNGQYAQRIDFYLARHRVKPGITGWAQINGFRGETDSESKMINRVEHDLYYIENWSLLFDFYIMALTPIALIRQKNAY